MEITLVRSPTSPTPPTSTPASTSAAIDALWARAFDDEDTAEEAWLATSTDHPAWDRAIMSGLDTSTEFIPVAGLGTWVRPLLLAVAGGCALRAIAAATQALAFRAADRAPAIGSAAVAAADDRARAATLVVLCAAAVGIPAFLLWFYRAYRNLDAFGVATRRSPTFAAGCWFLPGANLVLPVQVAGELTRGSGGAGAPDERRRLALWWGSFVVASTGLLVLAVAGRHDTSGAVLAGGLWTVLGGAAAMLAGIVTAVGEDQHVRHHGGGQRAGSGPSGWFRTALARSSANPAGMAAVARRPGLSRLLAVGVTSILVASGLTLLTRGGAAPTEVRFPHPRTALQASEPDATAASTGPPTITAIGDLLIPGSGRFAATTLVGDATFDADAWADQLGASAVQRNLLRATGLRAVRRMWRDPASGDSLTVTVLAVNNDASGQSFYDGAAQASPGVSTFPVDGLAESIGLVRGKETGAPSTSVVVRRGLLVAVVQATGRFTLVAGADVVAAARAQATRL